MIIGKNPKSMLEQRPLSIATHYNNTELCRYAMQFKCNVYPRHVEEAVNNENLEILILLIDYIKKDPHDISNGNLRNPWIFNEQEALNKALERCIYKKNENILRYVMKRGANAFEKALNAAVDIGNPNLVKYFANKGGKISEYIISSCKFPKIREYLKLRQKFGFDIDFDFD